MHITKVELRNFKRFTDLTIDGIPQTAKLVLLIGSNGSGKSSVFDGFEVVNSTFKRQDIDLNIRGYVSKDKEKNPHISLVFKNDLNFTWGTDGDLANLHFDNKTGNDTRDYQPSNFYGRSSLRQVPRLTRTQLTRTIDGNSDQNPDQNCHL